MNTFLTSMFFALVALAAAKPGYNYQQPKAQVQVAKQSAGQTSVQSAVQFGQQQFVAPAPQFVAPVQQQNSFTVPAAIEAPVAQYQQNNYQPQQQTNYQSQQQTNYQPQQQTNYQPQQQINYQPQQQTIISKDIFIHSAPEETEEIGTDQGVEAGPLRKNYRIVFIKAPSQNLKLNLESLKRAQASNEEKTVIYVLSKKPDLANIQSQLSAVQTEQKAHKPEVYFIKYKTQEEANRAQQEIQAQYDSLGGSTHISDEGIAPVTSVIGGGRVNVGSVGPSSTVGNIGSVNVGSSNVQTSFNGGSVNSVGPSFTGGNVGNAGSVSVGNSNVQSVNSGQQSYQSTFSSSSNFGGVPSQNYLPSTKK